MLSSFFSLSHPPIFIRNIFLLCNSLTNNMMPYLFILMHKFFLHTRVRVRNHAHTFYHSNMHTYLTMTYTAREHICFYYLSIITHMLTHIFYHSHMYTYLAIIYTCTISLLYIYTHVYYLNYFSLSSMLKHIHTHSCI